MIITILFDMDGVVINSEPLWDQSSEELLKRYGRVYERGRSKQLCTGKAMQESIAIMQQVYQFEGNTLQLAAEWKAIVKNLYRTKLNYIDGFVEFIADVNQRKLKVAIATTSDDELLRIANDRLNLANYFGPNIYTTAQANCKSKPEPDIYLYAANRLNSRTEQCLVIEDSPLGIEAAKRAGMFCIGITTSYERTLLKKADLVVDSYSEIDLQKKMSGIGV